MADKIILKRSSILGKRPTNQVIQAGELALNTNSEDPGAFFEVSDGNIVKIGPTSVSGLPPVNLPEKGEMWFDLGEGALKIGTVEEAKKVWRSIAAPYLGGGGTTVFVAPEFPLSSDNLESDGQTLPFQTVTRAILELSKIYIQRVLAGFNTQSESNRYTVIIASSNVTVNNAPGPSVEDFSVNFPITPYYEVTSSDLTQFNSESGGLIVPAGISIVGVDLKKSVVAPSFVPTYRIPSFPLSLQGVNQTITSVFKCSGNTYFSNFSAVDKSSSCDIQGVVSRDTFALFRSERPHGFEQDQMVQVTISAQIDQNTGSFPSGTYYVTPVNTFQFFLGTEPTATQATDTRVTFANIPTLPSPGTPIAQATTKLYSAHRLRLFSNASRQEIATYYEKVQRAFSEFFGGKITAGTELVSQGDTVIVGPAEAQYPDNESSNTARNSSMYANQVNLRSEYGMCWGDFNGAIVSGFRSVVANACTAICLQNDPSVYEIYTTLTDENGVTTLKWWNLTQASYLTLPEEERPANLSLVPRSYQLDVLNETQINNIRYYYENLTDSGTGYSIGIVNEEYDYRHFGFRVKNGAYGQFQSIYTIGAAIGVWALNGGICNLTNSTTNFGSVSFKAEGFLGINTIGGASPNSKDFVFDGIQRPLALTNLQAEHPDNKKYLYLGGKVTSVHPEESNPDIQIVEINSDFYPNFILPYSLKPGSAVWIETDRCIFRGFFATDGGPTVITGLDNPLSYAKLRLRATDSTIPNTSDEAELKTFGVPYIRRFKDPRKEFERSYSFFIRNTSATAVAPQVGSVLRLNQSSQGGNNSLNPNVQFDPGKLGGWGRIFTVDAVQTGTLGAAPQFNYVIGDTNQDLSYYCAITVSDYSRPWRQGREYKNPIGSYSTYKNRNWYSAENNLWDCMYYGNPLDFSSENGPISLAPSQVYAPFVDTCVIDRQDPVSTTFQGEYGADPYINEYLPGSTYMRGATCPYPTYATTDCYDDDDGSIDLGLCLKDIEDPAVDFTKTTSTFEIVSPEQQAQFKTETESAQRYSPAVVKFSVLSPVLIPSPKQKVSVLQVTNESVNPLWKEYLRVISVSGVEVVAIRLTVENSYYPSVLPTEGTGYQWPVGSKINVCMANSVPESSFYDPDWTLTKSAVIRFFNLMGYPDSSFLSDLVPQPWGQRLLSITKYNSITPSGGYADFTDSWPLEFNQPSTVVANTHTWAYSGYYNYSRGLLKYQTTDITRKLAADYQATTTWSGRLTVTGINDKGEIVQFGPQRQALTANYYTFSSPAETVNVVTDQPDPSTVEFPSQVCVYSVDDISSDFDGSTTAFFLTKQGINIPVSQLRSDSVFVVLGAVVQKPFQDYQIEEGTNKIVFSTAVPEGVKADIRVITTDDSEKTLTVIPFKLVETPNNSRSVFTAKPESRYTIDTSSLEVNSNNTFVIIGGVEQLPKADNNTSTPWSYVIDKIGDNTIRITFNEALPTGVTVDIRCFTTAPYWADRSIYPVNVYSLDSLTNSFNGSTSLFSLTAGGLPVNPAAVTQDNLIVSLGGAIQIPGEAYTVYGGQIEFQGGFEAPQAETTNNLRLIGNSEFISCQVNGKTSSNFLEWGPSLVLKLSQKLNVT